MVREGVKKWILSVKRIMRRFANLLGRRYIWTGLLVGFLWTFPVPFVLTAFLASFQNFPEEAIWVFFFPLKLSLVLTDWMMNLEIVDPVSWVFILWIISVFIGMLLGVVFTYSVHLIRVWRKKARSALI